MLALQSEKQHCRLVCAGGKHLPEVGLLPFHSLILMWLVFQFTPCKSISITNIRISIICTINIQECVYWMIVLSISLSWVMNFKSVHGMTQRLFLGSKLRPQEMLPLCSESNFILKTTTLQSPTNHSTVETWNKQFQVKPCLNLEQAKPVRPVKKSQPTFAFIPPIYSMHVATRAHMCRDGTNGMKPCL